MQIAAVALPFTILAKQPNWTLVFWHWPVVAP